MFANKVLTDSTSTGTANLTIGSTIDGHQNFTIFGTNYFYYGIFNQDNLTEYELGIGHINAGALVRDYVIQSSNSNALVNFSAGNKYIYADLPANIANAAFLYKEQVETVATSNVDISTALENGDTLNGITLSTGMRVLLIRQTTASQNGIYIVPASGAASRALDFYTGFNALGSIITAKDRKSIYVVTSGNVIGTDNLVIDPVQLADEVYDLGSGSSLDYDNGRVQTKTLTANWSPTIDYLPEGSAIRLAIKQGSPARTITWPAITWDGDGSEPTLPTTNNNVVIITLTKLFGTVRGQMSYKEDD